MFGVAEARETGNRWLLRLEDAMSSFYISDETTFDEAAPGGVGVFVAGGEIDYAASPQLKEHIAGHIKAGTRHLVVDLSPATFIDSTAIGVLLGAAAKLRDANGGSLAVVCMRLNVIKIFEIAGVQRAIPLYQSREEALAALALVR
jgi:anti-sigma B factor antagonist